MYTVAGRANRGLAKGCEGPGVSVAESGPSSETQDGFLPGRPVRAQVRTHDRLHTSYVQSAARRDEPLAVAKKAIASPPPTPPKPQHPRIIILPSAKRHGLTASKPSYYFTNPRFQTRRRSAYAWLHQTFFCRRGNRRHHRPRPTSSIAYAPGARSYRNGSEATAPGVPSSPYLRARMPLPHRLCTPGHLRARPPRTDHVEWGKVRG